MTKLNRLTTASFDVDPQNCFTPLCPDELPVPGGHLIVDELNLQATKAAIRVGSKDAHSPNAIWAATQNEPQLSPVEGDNVDIRWNLHGVPGTLGFELIEGLPKPTDYDFFVWKGVEPDMHPYGACYHDLNDTLSTGVIEYLQNNGIKTVIVGGLATEYCVKLTVNQLLKSGFAVILNLSGCRGLNNQAVNAAIEELEDAGAIIEPRANDISVY